VEERENLSQVEVMRPVPRASSCQNRDCNRRPDELHEAARAGRGPLTNSGPHRGQAPGPEQCRCKSEWECLGVFCITHRQCCGGIRRGRARKPAPGRGHAARSASKLLPELPTAIGFLTNSTRPVTA